MATQRRPIASINVTPLVDVLLILLVVMMLAMPMFVKKLPVDLPQTTLSGAPTVVKSISIALSKDDKLFVDGNPATMAVVKLQVNDTVSVELSIDQEVPYRKVANLIADIQELKPKDISLMTR